MKPSHIKVIIPALNEQDSICSVIEDLPKDLISEIIVVDNGSSDRTADTAKKCGATILQEEQKGYGRACLKGIDYLVRSDENTEIVVFLDGDHSDHSEELSMVIEPIINAGADFVIGSRELGKRDPGSMTFPQIFGNRLSTFLIKHLYGVKFTDLGPFRAIRFDKLIQLGMEDKNYGWTVEMQLKAAKIGLKCVEVPVSYRKRIGKSKVSGTVKGTFMAGYKILWTIFKYL